MPFLLLWKAGGGGEDGGCRPLASSLDGGSTDGGMPPRRLAQRHRSLCRGLRGPAAALIANTWSQWQTARAIPPMRCKASQTLRTPDAGKYLINVDVVKRVIHRGGWKLGNALERRVAGSVPRILPPGPSYDKPSFREASLFILNQYEFLAAQPVRSGATTLSLSEPRCADRSRPS